MGVTGVKCLLCLTLKSPLFGSSSCLACLEVIFLGGCTRTWGVGIQTAVLFWPLQPGDLVGLAYTAFLSSSTRRPFCEEDASGALVRSVCGSWNPWCEVFPADLEAEGRTPARNSRILAARMFKVFLLGAPSRAGTSLETSNPLERAAPQQCQAPSNRGSNLLCK